MSQPGADRPVRVAIVGAGPAGVYVADVLMKSGTDVAIDLFERQPAPYGLIRYGVAPDHPRIKGIITALRQVLSKPQVRLLGNVAYGVDVKLEDLREHYDAVVFTTGAEKDRDLDVPGIDLPGSFGGADFVSWFDGHPDVPRSWPLEARSIAVIGAGNVALDVSRMLSKTVDELLVTEIPENVAEGLRASPIEEVHVFARRGPAQAKFTPLELRELDHSPSVEVLMAPEDFELDAGSVSSVNSDNQTKLVVRELERYAMRTAQYQEEQGSGTGERPRKLWLHFFESPVEVLGDGRVEGLRTERTELAGDGTVTGTGQFRDWPVQAVYRCVGYRSTELVDLPWDSRSHVVPHAAGRVLDLDGEHVAGLYVNGWVKRGPVGLIGHTKGDAIETVGSLLADLASGDLPSAPSPDPGAVLQLLEARGLEYTTWEGWDLLDAHEISLGVPHDRARIKVVDRQIMVEVSRAVAKAHAEGDVQAEERAYERFDDAVEAARTEDGQSEGGQTGDRQTEDGRPEDARTDAAAR